MGNKYKLNDDQFNDIRIAACKIDAIGGFLGWVMVDDVCAGPDFYRELGETTRAAAGGIEKILNKIERAHLGSIK
jgi:hypothetical protein